MLLSRTYPLPSYFLPQTQRADARIEVALLRRVAAAMDVRLAAISFDTMPPAILRGSSARCARAMHSEEHPVLACRCWMRMSAVQLRREDQRLPGRRWQVGRIGASVMRTGYVTVTWRCHHPCLRADHRLSLCVLEESGYVYSMWTLCHHIHCVVGSTEPYLAPSCLFVSTKRG
jgi:hypothetical protein